MYYKPKFNFIPESINSKLPSKPEYASYTPSLLDSNYFKI